MNAVDLIKLSLRLAVLSSKAFMCQSQPNKLMMVVWQVAANPSRIVARILHGLSSPEYPAKAWSKCGFWARYTDVAFSTVMRVAQRQRRS